MPRIFSVSCLVVAVAHMVPVVRPFAGVAGDFFNGLLSEFFGQGLKRQAHGLALLIAEVMKVQELKQ